MNTFYIKNFCLLIIAVSVQMDNYMQVAMPGAFTGVVSEWKVVLLDSVSKWNIVGAC